jgi:hypothetical protein
MITPPLYALLHKEEVYHWGEEQQAAFETLKREVLRHAMLFTYNPEFPLVLRTDASNVGMGACLYQKAPDGDRPLDFFSKQFKGAELNYSTVEQEALAAYTAIKHNRHYLRGRKFLLETDSKSNTFIQTANNEKVQRWRLHLQEYDYELKHIGGHTNHLCDLMSRVFVIDINEHEDEIAQVHNGVVGHMGIAETIKRLEDNGHSWDTMRQDVVAFIQSCPICAKTRVRHAALPMEPRTIEVWEPFESVSVDFVGPFKQDAYGNKMVMVTIDNFTRMVELCAVPDATALSAARALLNVFARYGCPLEVRSDKGSHYAAEIIRQFLALCDVKQRFSLPYHPQGNGLVERSVQECNRHLRALICEQHIIDSWSLVLPLVQRIINSTPHSATGVAPATLVYGGNCNLNRNLFTATTGDTSEKNVAEFLKDLMLAQQVLTQKAQRQQAQVLDKRVSRSKPTAATTFKKGQTVLLLPPKGKPASKLAPRLLGPYIIIGQTGTNSYNIRLANAPDTDDLMDVHLERLVPYTLPRRARMDEVIAADDINSYLVEAILEHRRIKNGNAPSCFEYFVKYEGYEVPEWQPSSVFRNNSIFNTYLATHRIGRR